MSAPSVANTRWPTVVFSTTSANDELQAEAPRDGPQVDRAPVGRERVGDPEDHDRADQRLRPGEAELGRERRGDRQGRAPAATIVRSMRPDRRTVPFAVGAS